MNSVAIVGVGLVGASFALALREAGFAGEISGVSSPPAIQAGVRRGAISRGVTLEEAARTADLLYLAQPVDRILKTIEKLGSLAMPDCLVTDAGSTKAAVVEKARGFLPNRQFLGGHPLAGKAQRGADAAEGGLFANRPYVLTPTGKESAQTRSFREWLGRIGARVVEMSAEEHDKTVALTSHVPQLLSTALAAMLSGQENDQIKKVFGPGLLDMTRLALSDGEVWRGILASNEANVKAGLDLLIGAVMDLRNSIGKKDLMDTFRRSSSFAEAIRNIPYSH